jgi:glycosyltransferase involved in cell wall biosynthesis
MLLTLQEGDEERHLERYVLGSGFLYRIFIRPWHLLPIRKADYLTVISQGLKKRAIANGVKKDLIEVVPNGVDVQKFKIQNSKFKITIENSKVDIKEDDKIIITVSRLVGKNGIGDLIEAMNILKTQNPELKAKLLILGNGPLEEKLKFQVSSFKLQDQVFFLGHKTHEDLPQYFALADIFVRPSLSEGLGNSFLEAMASGVPIIGTRVGGIPDFLSDGETGLFCEVRNSQSIAEKIKLLSTDENLRQKLIINGRKLVEEKYNWDKLASKMLSIFAKAALA